MATLFAPKGHSTSPIIGEVRYDADRDTMQTWDGKQWVTMYGHRETVLESLQESIDRIVTQVEEDNADNVAVKDALKEWEEACEKFQVVLALAEKK